MTPLPYLKTDEKLDEEAVEIRIFRGIKAFCDDASPEEMTELYNQYACAGSGVIEFNEDDEAYVVSIADEDFSKEITNG